MDLKDKEKKEFVSYKVKYCKNDLFIDKSKVMMNWENPIMEMLADVATKKKGNTLEIGLGMGISALHILKKHKGHHTIIEAHPKVVKYGKRLFIHHIREHKLQIIEGFWEDITKEFKDESFDGILFDTIHSTKLRRFLSYNNSLILFKRILRKLDSLRFPKKIIDKTETIIFGSKIQKPAMVFYKEAYRLLKKGGAFTFFSRETKKLSQEEIKELKKVGFSTITYKICKVNPPVKSKREKTIVIPIAIK